MPRAVLNNIYNTKNKTKLNEKLEFFQIKFSERKFYLVGSESRIIAYSKNVGKGGAITQTWKFPG